MDYPGKVITKNQVTPTQTSAAGVWTLDDAAAATRNNNWPVAGVPNPISKSLRFNSADSAYLNRTVAAAATSNTLTTLSFWFKRSKLSTSQIVFSTNESSNVAFYIELTTSDTLRIYLDMTAGGSDETSWVTTAVFRDVSAWYHAVIKIDVSQASNANKVLLYINNVSQTLTATQTGTAVSTQRVLANGASLAIGKYTTAAYYGDFYLTEFNFIDGQALTPSSFGMTDPVTGVWEPLKYSGTYGTNGFYLNFKDATSTTTLGLDYSGNSNTWTTNNFSVTAGAGNDSLTDVPTPWIPYNTTGDVGGLVRGNYATWNPLDKDDGITSVTNGNLNVVTNGSNGSIKSTIAFPSGKWYWEVTSDTVNSGGTQAIGIIPQSQPPTNNMSDSGKLGYALDVSFSDRKFENGTATSYGTYTQANGAIYMLAFDQAAGKLWYGINGTWLASGDPAAGTNASSSSISTSIAYCAAVSDNTVSGTFTANFGQRPFAYTPPSGFLSLCTTNLPASTVLKGSEYMNAVLYTGNGSTQSITGVGFQPDWVWLKSRSNATDNELIDAVRGATKSLVSNSTAAEATDTNGLTAFASDGFSLGTDANYNGSARTFVAWNWKANGAGVTNTAGSITSTVSANTTSGFSIVTYTGNGSANQTVGHGLGVAPAFGILKDRDPNSNNDQWQVFHTAAGDKYAYLSTTAAFAGTAEFYPTTSSSTTVTIARGSPAATTNESGDRYVMYLFAPISGFSAFGSYTGNGSTDGPFIYLGFRPRWIMYKRTDTSGPSWVVIDTARDTYNYCDKELYPNLSNSENTGSARIDILSNGYKIRSDSTYGYINASGGTYIYAAFAENPFKNALAR